MIIEGMHFGVSKHLFDKHFTILWANDYAYGLTGYTKDEFYVNSSQKFSISTCITGRTAKRLTTCPVR